MHEINVLTNWTILATLKIIFKRYYKGGYPDLNREPTVPHTVALPIELHPPFFFFTIYLITRVKAL